MKYELGDYVQISKRWKKTSGYPFKEDFNEEREQNVVVRKKIDCKEKGFIAGFRYGLKQTALYHLETKDIYPEKTAFNDQVVEIDLTTIDVYLVATRMNCLYEVSKEDIEIIKDVEELR